MRVQPDDVIGRSQFLRRHATLVPVFCPHAMAVPLMWMLFGGRGAPRMPGAQCNCRAKNSRQRLGRLSVGDPDGLVPGAEAKTSRTQSRPRDQQCTFLPLRSRLPG